MTFPGMTVPLRGVPLGDQASLIQELAAVGYTDVWSSEIDGWDAFSPLVLASTWAPTLRLGTAIVPAYTRAPTALANQVATLADLAPGRFTLGIGASSNVIVERWNGIPFVKPYQRVRDMTRFLKEAMTGAKVTRDYETFSVNGFRLGLVPEQPPKIMIAALRQGMLRLAGKESDGAILNWLSATDVATVAPFVHEGGPGKEIVARIFVCPSADAAVVRPAAKRMMASYLTVPVYAKFHEWLGRGEMLAPVWERWNNGDRAGAVEQIPDELVDELFVHGTMAQCRAHIARYFDNGVTTTSLMIIPIGDVDQAEAVRGLSPSAG